jgi:hypothetical protein
VIVLDENVLASQRDALAARRIRLCQIGSDIGHKGMTDESILTLLRQIRRPTFCSRDKDFFDKSWRHESYCLAYFDLRPLDVAQYVRRLLRHPEFKTWSQRRGCVVRVSASGILTWRANASRAVRYRWPSDR